MFILRGLKYRNLGWFLEEVERDVVVVDDDEDDDNVVAGVAVAVFDIWVALVVVVVLEKVL